MKASPDIVKKLLRERNAVLLAHNYQRPEVQDAASYVGDSLGLSIKAMEADADIIVFAGVDFMAEQAAVLNPGKLVIHPDTSSRCPMAMMISIDVIQAYRKKYPRTPLVLYVNSPAEAKAIADYVVTSSSAVKLVSQLESDIILFGPDRNLAEYVAETTGKKVVPVPGCGHCPVHVAITAEDVKSAKASRPQAKVLAHPECTKDVRDLADFVGSTSQMVKAGVELGADEYIVATEEGLLHRFKKLGIKAYPASPYAVCVNMKKITLDKIIDGLVQRKGIVQVEPKIARKVRNVLEKSFELIEVEVPWQKR